MGSLVDALVQAFPGTVSRDVPLARISRWRIGGRADVVVRPRSVEELCRLRAFLTERTIANTVIGATSNLLFSDEGLRAVAVQMGQAFGTLTIEGSHLIAGAGLWVPGMARSAMKAGLAGLEHTCGIPGTLGGLVCMNGGSLRHGISEVIVEVTSVDRFGRLHVRKQDDCGFAYRRSIFQENGEVVVGTRLKLEPPEDFVDARLAIRSRMLKIMGDRRRKFPHHTPNCGSVFVSDPEMYERFGPPGAVIERIGFKGRSCGGAQVSPAHANFIVNTGNARALDVLSLIAAVKKAVFQETGYNMEVEARYVRPDGVMVPADWLLQSGEEIDERTPVR